MPENYDDYYTKLYLLSQIHTRQFYSAAFKGSIFGGPYGASDVRENFTHLQRSLNLANALALLMIRKRSAADNDVAACAILVDGIPPGYQAKAIIAKNQTTAADSELVQELLEVLHGYSGESDRSGGGLREFSLRLLEYAVVPHCYENLTNRIRDVAAFEDWLQEAAENVLMHKMPMKELEEINAELKRGNMVQPRAAMVIFGGVNPVGYEDEYCDKILLALAARRRNTVQESISHVLAFIARKSSSSDIDEIVDWHNNYVCLNLLLSFALAMSRSFIVRKVLQHCGYNDDDLEEPRRALDGCGSYHNAFRIIYKELCSGEESAQDSFNLSIELLESSKHITVGLRSDWYELLNEFSCSKKGGGKPLGMDEQTIREKLFPTMKMIPATYALPFHCELQLAEYLRFLGIRKVAVGVSEDCCELCAFALGDHWMTSRRAVMGMLPSDNEIAHAMCAAVDDMLRGALDSIRCDDAVQTAVTQPTDFSRGATAIEGITEEFGNIDLKNKMTVTRLKYE